MDDHGTPVLVVGASMAGLRAAEQLRAAGWAGGITVVGEEVHPPYNRPPLSKEALAACRDRSPDEVRASVRFRQRASVADVQWELGVRAEASDLDGRTVTLSDGRTLQWQGLVVATGLRPRRLRLPGPRDGRTALRTVDDALHLGARLVPGARVAVVGGGFVGCEVASTARGLGCDVTIVEPLPAPLQRAVGRDVGDAVRRHLEARGIAFRTGRSAVAALPARTHPGRVGSVLLDDGAEVPADVVVEAVGSLPNTEWLDGNGLDLSDGVLCDRWMRVEGRPDVVAVGDVARFPNPRFDDVARRVEHWCTPTDTAKQAAATLVSCLAGGEAVSALAPVPSFWSDQLDLRLQSFGVTAGADSAEVVDGDLHRLEDGVVVHYRRHGRLCGVLLANVPASRHLAQRRLVDEANPVPPAQLSPAPATRGVPA